jgi:hypothetical protein
MVTMLLIEQRQDWECEILVVVKILCEHWLLLLFVIQRLEISLLY